MDDKMPKCDFEAAMRWARTRLEFGSPSGPNETERDDNLARCYLAMSAQAPGMEAIVRAVYEAWGCCDNEKDACDYVLRRLDTAALQASERVRG